LWTNTYIAQLRKDFTSFTTEPTYIEPAGSRFMAEMVQKSKLNLSKLQAFISKQIHIFKNKNLYHEG
jgi:hypothetical protein